MLIKLCKYRRKIPDNMVTLFTDSLQSGEVPAWDPGFPLHSAGT